MGAIFIWIASEIFVMHTIGKGLVICVLSLGVTAFAVAADEPPTADAGKPADSYLETAKGFKERADKGDVEAMYLLGELLIQHGPEPGQAEAKTLKEWRPIGNRFTAMQWIQRAADGGQPKARAMLCSLGNDPLAPAGRRQAASKYCEPSTAK
jgi:hypothetical protein